MKKVVLKIDGMSCSACEKALEKYLNKQDGVKASVSLVMQQALIEYDEKLVSLKDLDKFVFDAGYTSLGVYKKDLKENKKSRKYLFFVFGFLIICLMYISMSHMLHLPIISYFDRKNPISYGIVLFFLTIPFLFFGKDILKNGIKKIIHKSPNMDSLVTIGIFASFLYSFVNLILILFGYKDLIKNLYFESVAMIIYFVKLGRFIDSRSREKTKQAIQELVQITPEYATIVTKNGEIEVTIDEVRKGDILIAKPGMKIAVDGVITKGNAHIEESFITGESIPATKKVNDKVIAGSINMDGVIEYKAERIGKDSTISEIVRMVVEAANTKSSGSYIADKVSGYFAPIILILSLITFIVYLILGKSFSNSIVALVSVLVVACPCALGLATPIAMVVSIGTLAKKGILIKTSEILENAYKVDTIVFDKTGTLTYGDLRISRLANYSNYSNDKLLNIVASLEKNSIHPISHAFKSYSSKYEVNDFKNITGIGIGGNIGRRDFFVGNNKILEMLKIKNDHEEIEKEFAKLGNSILYVVENNSIIGIIGVKDIVRKNTKKVIETLKKMNKKIMMVSGDNSLTSNIIANTLGIDEVVSNVMPKEKKEVLDGLKQNGEKVMMVGDGINDAPSLASASIGVSLNGAADISKDSADIILLKDDLSKIIDLINISKKTTRIVKENLFWAFFYNALMIPIAMGVLKPFGISISPSIASIAMTISSLTVVCNSLRLREIYKNKIKLLNI